MLVSIIVPIYNAKINLARCLKSIVNQSYKNIEIILIDDGSDDGSTEICEKFKEKDERIFLVKNKNTGVSNARNTGLDISKGEYIQFVDSDDFIQVDTIQKAINEMSNKNADLLVYGINIYLNDKYINKISYDKNEINGNNILDLDFKYLYNKCFFSSPCNKIYKKSNIKFKFDERLTLGEDLDFNLNYMRGLENKILVYDECLYNYMNYYTESLSKKYNPKWLDVLFKKHIKIKCFYEFFQKGVRDDIIFGIFSEEYMSGLIQSLAVEEKNIIEQYNYFKEKNDQMNNFTNKFYNKKGLKTTKLVFISIKIKSIKLIVKNRFKLLIKINRSNNNVGY